MERILAEEKRSRSECVTKVGDLEGIGSEEGTRRTVGTSKS